MSIQSLVAVERNADWSDWSSISRSLADVLLLVQQPLESIIEFHARLAKHVLGAQGSFLQVVLMRGASSESSEPLSPALRALFVPEAAVALHVFPRDVAV